MQHARLEPQFAATRRPDIRESVSTRVRVDSRCEASALPAEERAARLRNPGFGKVFADFMVTSRYVSGSGWGDLVVEPWGPLSFPPSLSALHYGQAIFEGLKAFTQDTGSISVFRPAAHARRFMASAERMCMPPLPVEDFVQAVDALVRHNFDWLPKGSGESFYVRPLMFGSDQELGVRPSSEYCFVAFGSPVGNYFGAQRPLTVWVVEDGARAFPGGTGAVKCAGNYAGTLLEQSRANGCDQVVWLDGVERKYVEELSGMNIFFVFGSGSRPKLVTPALTDTLLPGVTRDSLLQLGSSFGWEIEERAVSVDEWRTGVRDGTITEAFACGTAAVLTPIGRARTKTDEWGFQSPQIGPATRALYDKFTDIQRGRAPDHFAWLRRIA